MVRRIDIFMPPSSHFGYLECLTKELYEAFIANGVSCRLLVAERNNPEPFLKSIFSDPPDCTFSLNGLLPDEEGRFFCDMIKIPHIAYLSDYPSRYASLVQSPRNIIVCPDLLACDFFKGLRCNNVIFLPQGINKTVASKPATKKKYNIVMLASCIDFKAIRDSWQQKYSEELLKLLDTAVETVLADEKIPYYEALARTVNDNRVDISGYNILDILSDLEIYIKGRSRMELLKAIKKTPVHLFGAYTEECWNKYIGPKNRSIVLHDAIPYEEALEVMRQSKIVLNSSPWMKNGGQERVFAAMALEAAVITNYNRYLIDNFQENREIFFYRAGNPETINERIAYILEDERRRENAAVRVRKKTLEKHTWDVRVRDLLKLLPRILRNIPK